MKAMKFRKSFLGGFKKADVMAYIEELQKEKSEPSSSQLVNETEENEIVALKKENERLVLALEKANEQIKNLSDSIERKGRISSEDCSKYKLGNIVSLADSIRLKTTESINSISGDISGMTKAAEDIAKDFEKAINKLYGDLDGFKKYLENSTEMFDETDDKAEEKIEILENINISDSDIEDESLKEILSQGYEIYDKTNIQQLEIAEIVEVLKARYA